MNRRVEESGPYHVAMFNCLKSVVANFSGTVPHDEMLAILAQFTGQFAEGVTNLDTEATIKRNMELGRNQSKFLRERMDALDKPLKGG